MTSAPPELRSGTGLGLLESLIRADQLTAVRRSVLISIPVNMLLGVAALGVSIRYGEGELGLYWFAASTVANVARIALCRAAAPRSASDGAPDPKAVERLLRWSWLLALASGVVWAFIPALCEGYTTPQTLFYLTVVCGITAGAVTHGYAFARIPICFITPPLLSVIGCLVWSGGFDRFCLAATVALYLGALIRSARESEGLFRETSRLKNEATTMARSLGEAHVRSTEIAEEMRHRASHDALTGLLNRAGFIQDVERRLEGASSPFCLMLLDLDGFKSINDVFGHKTGDRVLAEVARRLRLTLAGGDQAVARLGGDEFAIFYDPALVDESPELLATRLIAAMSIPFANVDTGRVGVSVGLHVGEERDITEMMICADAALYAAKGLGRNRHCTFDDALRRRQDMKRDVERDLPRALAEGALEVWYQPIFAGGGARVSNFEALVRWRHPRHGWIPPNDLVAIAALAGMSEPLLRFILKDVCGMMQTLKALGLGSFWVAMNVSPREMSQVPVDEHIVAALKFYDLPPSMLEIEVTEETAMDIRAVKDKLATLSRAGVRVAIDDFGVGYSSLAALRQLKVDRIKIDRCFVTGLSDSTEDQALVQAVLTLGASWGVEVVAEGVETAADLRTLQDLGCPAMQGYHLGRPMPAREALKWLRQSRALASF